MSIYLDNAATTWPDPSVVEAMARFRERRLGNSSSIHRLGVKAAAELESARGVIAAELKASPDEIYFTSSGTESNNLALKGYCLANRRRGNHLVVSAIEHPSVLETARWLARQGFRVTFLPVDKDGLVDPNELRKALAPETILVSVMHANNEVGVLQDLRALAAVCAERKLAFHSDACQSFTRAGIDTREPGLAMLSVSSHKIHGPVGAAALYIRAGIELEPLLHGGAHERGWRPGTHNVESIVGFAAAVGLRSSVDVERMSMLRDRTIAAILDAVPGTVLNGPAGQQRLCNNISFSFRSIEAKTMLFELDKSGISVSTGSACASGKKVASHVLTAMGRSEQEASESLRITLSKWTTQAELDTFVSTLATIVKGERARRGAAGA